MDRGTIHLGKLDPQEAARSYQTRSNAKDSSTDPADKETLAGRLTNNRSLELTDDLAILPAAKAGALAAAGSGSILTQDCNLDQIYPFMYSKSKIAYTRSSPFMSMIQTDLRSKRNRTLATLLATLLAGISLGTPIAKAQEWEEQSVRDSIAVLNEIMAVPGKAIPERLLAGAEGVAIIPQVIKGGFVIGARHGRGTLLVRDENGGWHAPVFITLTGGSIGWQAGIQSTDVVLVFNTKKSVQGVLSGKFTLGVDAAAAVGPVGRQASAATDIQLKAEMYSYARSRGLFLGASLDGSMLQVDGMANAAYYQSATVGQPAAVPPSALQLVQLVASYSTEAIAQAPMATGAAPRAASPQVPTLAQQHATRESDVIREQLSKTSPELFEQLDPAWISYLALPAEVFSNQSHPPLEVIQKSLQNYEQVRQNPQYQALTSLPSFQSTYGLLKHYVSTLGKNETRPILPPPPHSRR